MGAVDCFAAYSRRKWESEHGMNWIWYNLAIKRGVVLATMIDNLHCKLSQELNLICFPEGREKAVQDLEDRIHRMTFQDEA